MSAEPVVVKLVMAVALIGETLMSPVMSELNGTVEMPSLARIANEPAPPRFTGAVVAVRVRASASVNPAIAQRGIDF